MPAETVRPTRLELLRTRRRIVVAKKGLNLLKLKRSALIVEFFAESREAMKLRGDLRARIERGYESIRMAEMLEGPTRLESISMLLPDIAPVAVTTKNVMGVRTPMTFFVVTATGAMSRRSIEMFSRRVGPSIISASRTDS